MKTTYRALAWLIVVLVAAQAAAHAWMSAGATRFIAEGGTLNLDDPSGPIPFIEIYGAIWHTLAGMYLLPAVALIFVVVGYLSRNRRALTLAIVVLILVIAEVALGLASGSMSLFALIPGANALLLAGVALAAALLVPRDTRPTPSSSPIDQPRRPVASGA